MPAKGKGSDLGLRKETDEWRRRGQQSTSVQFQKRHVGKEKMTQKSVHGEGGRPIARPKANVRRTDSYAREPSKTKGTETIELFCVGSHCSTPVRARDRSRAKMAGSGKSPNTLKE